MAPSTTTTLRRASRADLPRMVRILLDAFASGPWGRHVCPPHLRVKPGDGDEFEWRMHSLASGFDSPGRETLVACQRGAGGAEEEEIVGWAQWIDVRASSAGAGALSPEEANARMQRELGPSGAAIDRQALDTMRREGLELEKCFDEVLGAERSKNSWHLAYLVIDPKHQREGIGRLLGKEGLDRAASQGRDVCLRATPAGRQLYLALGFEQVREQRIVGESQFAMVWKIPDIWRRSS